VAHQSADAELRDEPLIAELAKVSPHAAVFACDVRGIGESQPDTCGIDTFKQPYGCDFFYAIHAIMLDRPYVGQKTFDVLRVLDWLNDNGHSRVHLVGKGWGAVPAAFAALLSPHVSQVTLKNALTSFAAIAESESYSWPLSAFVPGILERFDLPDVYRALEKKRLTQLEPWGAVTPG
jgi:pimeloyl-ACP methyl ester carboxylesterase